MLTTKLGRKKAHRLSTIRNLVASLVLFEKVETTKAKAKVVASETDKIITMAKEQNLAAYRRILAYFYDKNAAKKAYNELSKRYANRNSGYIYKYQIANRPGDNSEMVRLELIDRKVFVADVKAENHKHEEHEDNVKVDVKKEKRIDKLTKTSQKGGIVTSVRQKSARKTGV